MKVAPFLIGHQYLMLKVSVVLMHILDMDLQYIFWLLKLSLQVKMRVHRLYLNHTTIRHYKIYAINPFESEWVHLVWKKMLYS